MAQATQAPTDKCAFMDYLTGKVDDRQHSLLDALIDIEKTATKLKGATGRESCFEFKVLIVNRWKDHGGKDVTVTGRPLRKALRDARRRFGKENPEQQCPPVSDFNVWVTVKGKRGKNLFTAPLPAEFFPDIGE